MARDLTYGITINGWERLLASLEANAEDFQHLELYRVQLEEALAQFRDAESQQTALEAAKQVETRRLHSTLANGRKLATFLRHGVRQRYGDGSEKLAEFDLQPFRGRPQPEVIEPPPVKSPPPEVEVVEAIAPAMTEAPG